jgi:hypothetical protein
VSSQWRRIEKRSLRRFRPQALAGSTRAAAALLLALALLASGCGSKPTTHEDVPTTRRVRNLHAFAKLYGVLRWFHPSDAASTIDWDQFAIDGAHAVVDAPDITALRSDLAGLIAPLAPTVRLAGPGEPLIDDAALHPHETAALGTVTWEHDGYGDTSEMKVYRSQRRFRAPGEADPTAPAAGATVDLDLGDGLRARVPIALFMRDGHTLGDDPRRAQWRDFAPRPVQAFDPVSGAADVIVVWNVLQHFWPYWDYVRLDWDHDLDLALADALDDRGPDDHLVTLQRLSAALPDGHVRVSCPGTTPSASLPFDMDWVEDRIVVTASSDSLLRGGDEIVAIDGIDARAGLEAAESLISGSPQFRRIRALHHLGDGPPGASARVQVRRDGRDVAVDIVRRGLSPFFEYSHPPFELLEGGIWYVDLSRISLDGFPALVQQLTSARGVVFDMRHYPQPNSKLISLLLRKSDDTSWLEVPRFTRPDHVSPTWIRSGSKMQPDSLQHIGGRVAFLTGPRQFSYGESWLGFVAYYHLGAIVGAPTAGINGNIAGIREPTGCKTIFTGMRVTNHNGSQHYQVGIPPTVPIAPTLAGLRANRDEVREAGLAAVRTTTSGVGSH